MKTRTFNILTFFVIAGVIALAILFMVAVPDVKDCNVNYSDAVSCMDQVCADKIVDVSNVSDNNLLFTSMNGEKYYLSSFDIQNFQKTSEGVSVELSNGISYFVELIW